MRHVLKLLIALILGLMAGWFSARLTESSHLLAGHVQAGAWQAWPTAGRSGELPHVRLHYQGRGQLPPSPAEQMEFIATHDDKKRRLNANCRYVLKGSPPQARLWMLGVEPEKASQQARFLLSTDIIAEPNGTLRIHLDQLLQPGNWLQLPREGAFTIVLRLFGASPLMRDKMLAKAPFAIRREGCR